MMAWFTALLLSPYTKKGQMIDPESLLPDSMKEMPEPVTKEEAKEILNDIKKALGYDDGS